MIWKAFLQLFSRESGEGIELEIREDNTMNGYRKAFQSGSRCKACVPEFIEEVVLFLKATQSFDFVIFQRIQKEKAAKNLWQAHERMNTMQALPAELVDRFVKENIKSNDWIRRHLAMPYIYDTTRIEESVLRGDWKEPQLRMLLLAMAYDDLELTEQIAQGIQEATKDTNINYFFGVEETVRDKLYEYASFMYNDDEQRAMVAPDCLKATVLSLVQNHILDMVLETSSAETKFYGLWAIASICFAAVEEMTREVTYTLKELGVMDELMDGVQILWGLLTDDDIRYLMREESFRRKNYLDGFEAKMAFLDQICPLGRPSWFHDDHIVSEMCMVFSGRRSTFCYFERISIIQNGILDRCNTDMVSTGEVRVDRQGNELFSSYIRRNIQGTIAMRLHGETRYGTLRAVLHELIRQSTRLIAARAGPQGYYRVRGLQMIEVDNMLTDAMYKVICLYGATKHSRWMFRRTIQIIKLLFILGNPKNLKGNLPGIRGVMAKIKIILDPSEETEEGWMAEMNRERHERRARE